MSAPTRDSIRPIAWRDDMLYLLDQRVLPEQEEWLVYKDVASVADAIRDMVVRGAPAIGISAAYGVVLAARARYRATPQDWHANLAEDLDMLRNARPTAVNLDWAVTRMSADLEGIADDPTGVLLERAKAIHAEDLAANYRMGRLGADLLQNSGAVITHCNAGALATGGYGTALGVIRAAYEQGKINHVYADETRPWLQGARLTAWELQKEAIPVTLLVDSAAAHMMRRGGIGWVIVGSDRIAANGDVANKIGTYPLAIAARYHGVKFMVVAPTSTLDLATPSGDQIAIENRNPTEITELNGRSISARGVDALNPAFDITPAELVDVIVTEKGVIEQPNQEKLRAMMEKAG